jgi:hypothetical protein
LLLLLLLLQMPQKKRMQKRNLANAFFFGKPASAGFLFCK